MMDMWFFILVGFTLAGLGIVFTGVSIVNRRVTDLAAARKSSQESYAEYWKHTEKPLIQHSQRLRPEELYTYSAQSMYPDGVRTSRLVNEALLDIEIGRLNKRIDLLLAHLNLSIVGPTEQPALPMRVVEAPKNSVAYMTSLNTMMKSRKRKS